jgi:2-amino-4-hydroxy-6-hydroxymethyldihydropteridine diphosphokinase
MPLAYISLGSNIAPEPNIFAALRLLGGQVRIVGISSIYLTPPLERPEQDPYYNGVIAVETDLPPVQLKKDVLTPIEDQLGRRRGGDKYAPRTLDFDLLLYDDLILNTPELTLPHPDLLRRSFVAAPLLELAPTLIVPGLNRPLAELLRSLEKTKMILQDKFTETLRETFIYERESR